MEGQLRRLSREIRPSLADDHTIVREGLRAILLTMHAEDGYVLEALRAGVRGYVLKKQAGVDLVRAIHEVVAGGVYLYAIRSGLIQPRASFVSHFQESDDPDESHQRTQEGDIREALQAFVALFVAVDILGLLPIYLSLTGNLPTDKRRRLPALATLTALAIGLGFMLIGRALLRIMGVSVGDFQVAGGLGDFLPAKLGIHSISHRGDSAYLSGRMRGQKRPRCDDGYSPVSG